MFERGDDKARIGAVRRVLSLADDAPFPAPAVERAIPEVAEQPGGAARRCTQSLRLRSLIAECCLQAGIARQAEHVIDAVRLAPPHQRIIGEAAVGAESDAHPPPFLADLRDNARYLFDRTVAARDVRAPLAGQ